jgi:guanylate kinase
VPGLALSVSATTRAPRPGEVDGRDYHFLSDAEFDSRIEAGEFLEHAEYAGSRYGTLRSELSRGSRGVVLEIEVKGARQVRDALPEALRVFIAPPDPESLRSRLEGRGLDPPDQIERRLEVAREELAAQPEFQHVVVNDDRDRASAELVELVATMA